MQRLRTSALRAVWWLTAGWFVVGAMIETELQAIPHDPYLQRGGGSGPWISDRLPRSVRRKIESAIELVAQRLEERPSCADLFAALGADGAQVLDRTLYYPADALMERRVCRRAYAFTRVGVRPTWICRRMWLLPVWRFAVVLLHEALHHAGMREWPQSPVTVQSRDITGRVIRACGF